MSDLVQRLRDYEEELGPQCGAAMVGEAADEIERLTRERDAIDKMAKNLGDEMIARGNQLSNMTAERERLTSELKESRSAYADCSINYDRLTREKAEERALYVETKEHCERLRAALERIAEEKVAWGCGEAFQKIAREALADKLDEDDSVKKHNEMRVKMGLAPILLAPQPTITQGESLPLEIRDYSPLDEEEE